MPEELAIVANPKVRGLRDQYRKHHRKRRGFSFGGGLPAPGKVRQFLGKRRPAVDLHQQFWQPGEGKQTHQVGSDGTHLWRQLDFLQGRKLEPVPFDAGIKVLVTRHTFGDPERLEMELVVI